MPQNNIENLCKIAVSVTPPQCVKYVIIVSFLLSFKQ